MKQIRTLLVDDEAPALQRMERLLAANADFVICGTCVNGKEALRMLQENKIDLLLMDIEMPVMSGLALLEKIDPVNRPWIVFVTAYDEYAVTAFEYYAIDYLLKPFTNERFEKMLSRVKEHIQQHSQNKISFKELNETMQYGKLPGNRIAVKTGRKYHFIEPVDIAYIIADGNYCRIILHSGEKHIHRETLTNLITLLPDIFIRIHHSYIVSQKAIKQLNRLAYGEMELCMQDDVLLKVSRRYKDTVRKMIR